MKVINWVIQNKEWLFSGGGVVLIAFLYNFFFISRKPKKFPNQNPLSNPNRTTQAIEDLTLPDITYSTKPLPIEIINKLNEVPPFQSDDISKSYVNLAVEWETTFHTLHKIGTGYRLMLNINGSFPWIYCNVDLQKYPELKIAPQGTKIIVQGKIKSVAGHEINLEKARIKVVLK